MKNTLLFLGRSALFGFILAVSAAGQSQNRPLRPVPLSPPGSNQSRIPWTELQTVKLENLGLRQNAALAPIIQEREALLVSMCADAGFQPGSCTYDPPSHTVTGTPLISPDAKKKKHNKHDKEPQ